MEIYERAEKGIDALKSYDKVVMELRCIKGKKIIVYQELLELGYIEDSINKLFKNVKEGEVL
jgi:hypothetical protein